MSAMSVVLAIVFIVAALFTQHVRTKCHERRLLAAVRRRQTAD